jgi:hypothetical protein
MRTSLLVRLVCKLIVAVALVFGGLSAAYGQENGATIKFNLFSIEGFTLGDSISIDAEFGQKYGVPIPAPFTFVVPRTDGVVPFVEYADDPEGMYIKINFATEGRQLIDSLQFVRFNLPMDERGDDLIGMARFLANEVFSIATASYPENEYIDARPTTIGGNQAVEVVGRYINPDIGVMYLRIVGIVNADGPDSVIAISNIVADRFDFQNLDELSQTNAGATLKRFKFK